MITLIYFNVFSILLQLYPFVPNQQTNTSRDTQKRYKWGPVANIMRSWLIFCIRLERLMNKLPSIGNSLVRSLFLSINIDYKEIICVSCFKNAITHVNYALKNGHRPMKILFFQLYIWLMINTKNHYYMML